MDKSRLLELAEKALDSALELSRKETGWNRVCDLGCAEGRLEWRDGEPRDAKRDLELGQAGVRAWRVQLNLEADVETVGRIIMDINNMHSWNPALKHSQVLEKLDSCTMISYQITDGQSGLVQPRDFLFLSREDIKDKVWMAGGCSVSWPTHPPTDKYVRAWQYPGIMSAQQLGKNRTMFCWLLQCDFGGILPKGILNAVFPYAIKLFCNALKNEVCRKK